MIYSTIHNNLLYFSAFVYYYEITIRSIVRGGQYTINRVF